METETTSPRRAARIFLALALTLGTVTGLVALLRPSGGRSVPIAALGAAEDTTAATDAPAATEGPTTTTLAPEATTAPTETPTTAVTAGTTTTVTEATSTTGSTTGTTGTTTPTVVTAPPQTTTTVPETTTTTLGNTYVACYPDNMPIPQINMPGMDNPMNGPCHVIGTLPDGTTVANPYPPN